MIDRRSVVKGLSALTLLGEADWTHGSGKFIVGVNYPWISYGADFGDGGFGHLADPTQWAIDFATFASQGVRVVRWFLMGDGRYCPVWNLDGTTVGLNTNFLNDIDAALAICATNDIYIIFSVLDFTAFNQASDAGSGVTLGGHEGIIKDTTLRTSFLDNAFKPLLQHVAASANRKRVYAWEIFNELEDQLAGGYNGYSFFTGPAQFALSDAQDFVRLAASYVHTYGGGVKVTTAAAIPVWCPLWIGLGLDFHQAHYYDWMDLSVPGDALTPVADITATGPSPPFGAKLEVPCILGEYASAGTGETYGLNDTAVHSARWYLDTAVSRGYAGAIVWSKNSGDIVSDWASFQPVYTNWVEHVHPVNGP